MVGLLLALVGESIRFYTVGHTLPGTSGREKFLRADELNSSGFYAITRNPLYLGNLVIYSGLLVAYGNIVALALGTFFFILQYHLIILSEEAFLKIKHGALYDDYCRRVPRLLPRFNLFRTPTQPFQLLKAIFKESDSVFNLLILYLIILTYKEHLIYKTLPPRTFYWAGAIILVVLYAGLKVLKKKKFQ